MPLTTLAKNPKLKTREAIEKVLGGPEGLSGKTVIDVGCGDGAMVRYLASEGAKAVGIEVSESQLHRARAKQCGKERYLVGQGESLPCEDESVDVVLYLNSLHHLHRATMAPALIEAARVLRTGGALIVIEPLAQGNYFEAMRVIEDETEVRAAAYSVLQNPPPQLRPEGELVFEDIRRLRDADHFIEAILAVDPSRTERLPLVESELRRRFENYKQQDERGPFFVVPLRRNVFRKIERQD